MGVYSSILLGKTLDVQVPFDKVTAYLSSYPNKHFDIQKLTATEYKVIAHYSMGIGKMGAKWAEGINVILTLKALSDTTTKVEITSTLRIELVFFSIISALAIFFMVNSSEKQSIWSIVFFPVALIWFWLVYRFQEKRLALKIEQNLLSLL